jgi:hypothetical protein
MISLFTPTNGAVDVPTNSPIVFVFDQDMNTKVAPFASKPGLWVGNFAITPTNLNVTGQWNTNKRTLTLKCTPGWPYLTNITWTLNPPTNSAKTAFPPFSSATNVLLATVSGGFTTAAGPPPPPTILSVSPTNRAVEVPPLSSMVFTFDEDMDTSVQVVATGTSTANCGFSVGVFSNAVWSADKRTLIFTSMGQIPLGTLINWDLNPNSAGNPLKNSYGEPLAYSLGSFTVLTNTGGNPSEICQNTTNNSLGRYTITEILRTNIQLSANTVLPLSNSVATFVAYARSPLAGDRSRNTNLVVTSGSLTLPDGTLLVFTNEFVIVSTNKLGNAVTNYEGILGLYDTNATDAVLPVDFPPGTYVMRIDQQSGLESTISMTIPGFPPVPMIVNYDAAQAIDAGHDFILQWNQLPTVAATPFAQVTINDTYGKLIFAAPNPCVSRTLDGSATSVVIPANTLRPGVVYEGQLEFAYTFYNETNAVPSMTGDGNLFRTTSFQLQTSFAPNTFVVTPPSFTEASLSSPGQPVITFHGMPGASYTIQRTASLAPPNWVEAGSVNTDSSGNGSFQERTATTFPAFYRAKSN